MARKVTTFRPARSIDAIQVAELLHARGLESVYAGRDEVDIPYARKMFAQAVQRHGGKHDGSTFFMVAEDEAGDIAAFVLAYLGRVYGVGHKLVSCDQYLLGRKDCPPRALRNLFELYMAWASSNPRVVEVGASFSDAFPGSEAWAPVFARLGFEPCAQSFRKFTVSKEDCRVKPD